MIKQQHAKIITQNSMSNSFVESAASVTGFITVLATAAAALSGCLYWYFSTKEAKWKEEQRVKFEQESKLAISEANARAAEANETAEKERLARIRLEEDLAWRRLSKEQQDILISKLSVFSDQSVSVWYGAGDKEAETFAWEFATVLYVAKWQVFSPASSVTMAESGNPFGSVSRLETGVTVSSSRNKSSQQAAQAVARELLALGFNATKSSKLEKSDSPMVWVNIEVRPKGPQGQAKLRKQKK